MFPVIAKDDNLDFSPRVGFAYDLTGKGNQVIRGGYGLYYGNVFQNIPLFMEQMSNPTVFQTVLSLSSTYRHRYRYRHTRSETGAMALTPCPPFRRRQRELARGSVGRLMDPHYRNPVTEEFNGGYSWSINQKCRG